MQRNNFGGDLVEYVVPLAAIAIVVGFTMFQMSNNNIMLKFFEGSAGGKVDQQGKLQFGIGEETTGQMASNTGDSGIEDLNPAKPSTIAQVNTGGSYTTSVNTDSSTPVTSTITVASDNTQAGTGGSSTEIASANIPSTGVPSGSSTPPTETTGTTASADNPTLASLPSDPGVMLKSASAKGSTPSAKMTASAPAMKMAAIAQPATMLKSVRSAAMAAAIKPASFNGGGQALGKIGGVLSAF